MSRPEIAPSSINWDDNGQPRSRLYGDLYFSRDDGLAESRAVFLQGCRLPEAWAGRDHFCVGELGFGTGLNIAALLDLWTRAGPPGGRLSIFSVEAHPITAAEAARALAAWPALADSAQALVSAWPGQARGLHRIDLADRGVTLDIAVMDIVDALTGWRGRAEAWFLDGFAPALNPRMWSAEVMALVAARSAPGARAATYTVAGAVRRDLAAAGFVVERRPGFGRKRERLEAALPPAPNPQDPHRSPAARRVAIIGAGIAGAALYQAFRRQGLEAVVFDAEGPGAGASGGPAALVAPRLDAGLGPAAALFAQALCRATTLYERTPGVVIARGAVQFEVGPKDPGRFTAIAGSDLFEPGSLSRMSGEATSALLGETAPAALRIGSALVIDPRVLLGGWLGETSRAPVAMVAAGAQGWRLIDAEGLTLMEADIVCIAAGMASLDLAPGLPDLIPVRGQATLVPGVASPMAALFGGYAIPSRFGLLFGATHDRGDAAADLRPADDARNLTSLSAALPALAQAAAARPSTAWAAVRATTTDYLPLAGGVPGAAPGLFTLTGLGSRGFCLAPLLADQIAALALGRPEPVMREIAALVDPARFATRAARKGRQDRR